METIANIVVGVTVAIHPAALFLLIVVLLAAIAKGADVMVDEAVVLARNWGVPKIVIGATIISLGTTAPEAAISVMAALQGNPDLALGNAVGSVIADTGLILGVACLIAPPYLERSVVNRQGWIQLGAGVLLVAAAVTFGGRLPRPVGFVFLGLLVAYIWGSVRWMRMPAAGKTDGPAEAPAEAPAHVEAASTVRMLLKLLFGLTVVVIASRLLVPAVGEAAVMLHIPPDIIAATLVALGTSTPELATAIVASLKRQGEVALGNVIGADILNVLFVVGAACAATPGGLEVPANFFRIHFPFLLAALIFLRIGITASRTHLGRGFGAGLILLYVAYLATQTLAVVRG